MTASTAKSLRILCLVICAAAFVAAGAIMVLSDDNADGIFAVLIAALLARFLVLDAGRWLERRVKPGVPDEDAERHASSESPEAE